MMTILIFQILFRNPVYQISLSWMMLIMTFLVSLATFGTGRTNIMFGMVHLVMFAVFMFLVLVP